MRQRRQIEDQHVQDDHPHFREFLRTRSVSPSNRVNSLIESRTNYLKFARISHTVRHTSLLALPQHLLSVTATVVV